MADWNSRANDLFLEAKEIAAGASRDAFLNEACGGDEQLQAEVVALLVADQQAGSFLQRPVTDMRDTTLAPGVAEGPGTMIGSYKLLQQLGEGGMGVVFMAEQTAPVRRKVALKIIKPGLDTGHVIARFEAEQQALALIDHPNVARVFDAGVTETGRPYFVMELVKGIPITEYCDQHHLSPRERLELFIPVCEAVQHAHQKGIIHRDLKPTNIMIAPYDGKPVPKIIDFGLAKAMGQRLTERTLFTMFGSVVGTLQYMSPEQAELNQLDVDTRSDIYSLGVVLYELLTGTTPLDYKKQQDSALQEILRAIKEDDPVKPSVCIRSSADLAQVAKDRGVEPGRLSGAVRGELDWIVMKALEKDRNRRYETASGFVHDIQRYLADEPVHACPPSTSYRLWKLARRHKAALVTIGLVAASLLVGTVVSLWQMTLARRAETLAHNRLIDAEEARQRATAAEQLAQSRLAAEQEARQRADAEAEKASKVGQLLIAMLGEANPESGRDADYTVREMLDDFSARLGPELDDQPEIAADIHAVFGNTYKWLGVNEKAEHHLKAALELCQRIYGHDHPEVARVLSDYAHHLRGQNRFADAEKRAREAWAIHQKLGIENGDTVQILHRLQLALFFQRRLSEANEIFEKAMRISQQQSEPPPAMADVLSMRAITLIREGKPDEAEPVAYEAVALHRKVHGDYHPETGWGLYFLGLALAKQGKLDAAEKTLRESVRVFRKIGGETTRTEEILKGLEDVLKAQRDPTKLAEFYDENLSFAARRDKFAVATGTFPAELARGKRIVYSGWIKTENVDQHAGLWWQADGAKDTTIAFDDMHDRGPRGTTDWTRFEIELDIPEETTNINFGVLMRGKGRAWFDGLAVSIDGEPYTDHEFDFDFELRKIKDFFVPEQATYDVQLDDKVAKVGRQSLRLESVNQPVAIDPSIYAHYVGRYQMPATGMIYTITQNDGRLMAKLSGQSAIQVFPDSESQFSYRVVDAKIEFERDENRKVTQLTLYQHGQEFVATRIEPGSEPAEIEIDPQLLDQYVGTYKNPDGWMFTVTNELNQLSVRMSTSQVAGPILKVFPKSPTRFFYREIVAEIEFQKDVQGDVTGLTMYQTGIEISAAKEP